LVPGADPLNLAYAIDMFGADDMARVAVDLSTPTGKIIPWWRMHRPKQGHLVTPWLRPPRRIEKQERK
jgi:hypothetical protein